MSADDGDLLRRWAARKSRAAREAGAAAASQPPAAGVQDAGAGVPELPPLDGLGPDSDYSAFLHPRVDAAIRRAALRKLFHQPAFNLHDGLDDCCGDYTAFTPLGKDVLTSDLRHRLEVEARRLAEAGDTEPAHPRPSTTSTEPTDGSTAAAGAGSAEPPGETEHT